MSFGELLDTNFIEFVIKTNNYCNLHCEHCTNRCDIPLKKTNENIFRRKKWEISIDDLVLFCERFKGIGEDNIHTLTGAETTMIPISIIHEMIDVLHSYRRPMSIRTTGWNLIGLGENHINKISKIFLADHGINHKCTKECLAYLDTFYKHYVKVENYTKHLNLQEIVGHIMSKGKRCNDWMRTPELVQGIIYPCCNMPWLMLNENTTRVKDELENAGWTVHNKNVVDVLREWRETIPKYVSNKCLNDCWAPRSSEIGHYVPITRKKNDSIIKNYEYR